MQIELLDGTNVRFLNGGSLHGAVYDFNCGDDPEDHLHVYLSPNATRHRFEFLCSSRSLTWEERIEAEELLLEKIGVQDATQKELLKSLLENDHIVAAMQGSVPDKCDAPRHVCRAMGFGPRGPLRSWADVKAHIAMIRSLRRLEAAMIAAASLARTGEQAATA